MGERREKAVTFWWCFAVTAATVGALWLSKSTDPRVFHVLVAAAGIIVGFLASGRFWLSFAGAYLGLMVPFALASALDRDPLYLAMFPYFAATEFVVILAAVSIGALTRRFLGRRFPQFSD